MYYRKPQIYIAAQDADICIENLNSRMWIEGNCVRVQACSEPAQIIYNNEPKKVIDSEQLVFEEGDELRIENFEMTLFSGQLACRGAYATSLCPCPERITQIEKFPEYKRSPRLIKTAPTETVEIKKPPEKAKISRTSLAQIILTPLIMLAITVAISILMKRGLFVIMSIASSVMSIAASVGKFIHDRSECRQQNEHREQVYEQYLLRKRQKLYRLHRQEEDMWDYNFPSVEMLAHMVQEYSSRIYERSANDGDFLQIALGYSADKASYQIKLEQNELNMEEDDLLREAEQVAGRFRQIDRKPVVADLKKAHLGMVGEKEIIHEQLQLYLIQLAVMHSYHELQIIHIYDGKYAEEYKWLNWLKHCRIAGLNVYGTVNSDKSRDQILGSMHQILKERKLKLEEEKKQSRFLPHYLFIIDEPKYIMDHAIMEYLGHEGDNIGISIIYTTHLQANLPENIDTILRLDNSCEGTLIMQEGKALLQKMTLQRLQGIDKEWLARDLSVLDHKQGIMSQIPEHVSFLELYQVERPEELDAYERWKKNHAHKSLAVPLGLRAQDDYLFLNLHEKAHGPHGLVAGTTGSGKSEIVQTYILSLAVNFHPHEVGFLLIDYKGGGMAGLFKKLPHLLGTITNLDGSESMRALTSIKSELARRQRLFSENNVNHINAYHKLYQAGEVLEPIPHLFLISDEFAELKKEQPDFMKELVSAARIGRSLGIHLILATQKPSGVVDDQIWTNSRFKLALKVQNEADSKEMLKTGDAAYITQPGRAYLQVGNNEIYELFQSAYSGAEYREDGAKAQDTEDNRVYVINQLGQGELINEDLSEGMKEEAAQVTQLDAVVDYLQKVYESCECIPVRKPWLPPLSRRILAPVVEETDRSCSREEEEVPLNLTVAVGLTDIPEEQKQVEYRINLLKDGNVAYFAAAGYGKSMFLTTCVISLALQNSVKWLNFYLCDFGNNALIGLNALPHTADYIAMDDTERLTKLMRILTEEMKERKKRLAEAMVQNFDVYRQSGQEPMKAIIVVIDHYDMVRELGTEPEEFFTRLSRDGAGLGIYMIITASRMGGVKYTALNNYRNRIAGYLMESTEASSLVGKGNYKVPEIEGRALVKLEHTNLMQVYVPVRFRNEVEYNQALKQLIDSIGQMYPTMRAPRIPVLPEQFYHTMIADYKPAAADIQIGLHKVLVEMRGMSRWMAPFIILGETARGKTNLLRVMLEQMQDASVYLFDAKSRDLYPYSRKKYITYPEDGGDLEDMIEELTEHTVSRKKRMQEKLHHDSSLNPRDVYAEFEAVYVVIDDIDDFLEFTRPYAREVLQSLKDCAQTGIGIIATMHSAKAKGLDETLKWFKSTSYGVLLGNPGTTGVFPSVPSKELPAMGEGLLFISGNCERLMLPRFMKEEGR